MSEAGIPGFWSSLLQRRIGVCSGQFAPAIPWEEHRHVQWSVCPCNTLRGACVCALRIAPMIPSKENRSVRCSFCLYNTSSGTQVGAVVSLRLQYLEESTGPGVLRSLHQLLAWVQGSGCPYNTLRGACVCLFGVCVCVCKCVRNQVAIQKSRAAYSKWWW